MTRERGAVDYLALSRIYDDWIDYPGYALSHDFSRDEYSLRLTRARDGMARAGLDALVITSGTVGQWFTSILEPHEWHDRCPARMAMFVLTPDDDCLYMTPTAGGEHYNTTRRSTWVSQIRGIAERAEWPRTEIWDVRQLPSIFADLGLERSRLGFELGDRSAKVAALEMVKAHADQKDSLIEVANFILLGTPEGFESLVLLKVLATIELLDSVEQEARRDFVTPIGVEWPVARRSGHASLMNDDGQVKDPRRRGTGRLCGSARWIADGREGGLTGLVGDVHTLRPSDDQNADPAAHDRLVGDCHVPVEGIGELKKERIAWL